MDDFILTDLDPAKEFFVGIDSDGCVFDTMETKHKECFTPMFVKHFGLQSVSKYAREVWDFVNLYSKTRGTNRFPALVRSLRLLRDRPEVIARGARIPDPAPLERWIAREPKLTNATLEIEAGNGDPFLGRVLEWSKAVNAMIADIVHDVPPFPLFRECLLRMSARADVLVVSQTPTEALQREWKEHSIAQHVRAIAGQELGSKADHLRLAAAGKYPPRKILMIGDAPGDLKAAQANHALFFPVNPGREEDSWRRFHQEGLDRFFDNSFSGAFEAALREEFEACLPENPPW
ncbi:MAG TPA: HAD family hydrolase [Candidatus Paceibacterota bacterium]|nr:HAD family hydrolase [Verrucomicrobiota bacterium]HOX00893.1 HAD family hydrolase [Verrucomicrobiota bacterium]HRZ43582.1 HAD family hydrolase [Candidatus Paceibacterota bacterium]HRZ94576.1 HAD family hydrolase [Candidatus Paceibacterota bacterium]